MGFNLTTFLFELVNFVVLAFLLQRYVYRPVRDGVLARRDEIATARTRAAEQLALVDTRAAELDARDRQLDELRVRIVAEATVEAAAEKAKLLARAREDAATERARVQSLLEAEREAALGWVRHVAIDRGAEVAGRLLLELVPEGAHQALVARLTDSVADRAAELQEAVVDGVLKAEATFARLPPNEDREGLRRALEAATKSTVRLTVSEDERLGAGVTLAVGDRVFDATVAGQLELLREEARRQLADGAEA
ncbi:MAG: F0F1 ATP synthase subunit delta [Alphaproteobacteria bacterium]|nr:F0F1 ATP synthase subunit delta [Alphaproteobacteria bacterium]MCB9791118.1 F0F1 ATP synthase subunit delta [Alphaproteobacteria bacterium]